MSVKTIQNAKNKIKVVRATIENGTSLRFLNNF